MHRKIRVAAVSYLNTKPLTYGFEHGQMTEKMDLVFEYPSNLASMLLNDQVDLALVPVAIIPSMIEYHIISDYCIGAIGEVASVCLFSDVPLTEIKALYLDYQSRTSAALLKILLEKHWKTSPQILTADAGYENRISGATAGLVIGDRALVLRKKYKYVYDLAGAWNEMTGLPFVFAAWISNKKIPEDFIITFNITTAVGFKHIDEIVATNKFEDYDLKKYYTENINYILNDKKKEGLSLFLKFLSAD